MRLSKHRYGIGIAQEAVRGGSGEGVRSARAFEGLPTAPDRPGNRSISRGGLTNNRLTPSSQRSMHVAINADSARREAHRIASSTPFDDMTVGLGQIHQLYDGASGVPRRYEFSKFQIVAPLEAFAALCWPSEFERVRGRQGGFAWLRIDCGASEARPWWIERGQFACGTGLGSTTTYLDIQGLPSSRTVPEAITVNSLPSSGRGGCRLGSISVAPPGIFTRAARGSLGNHSSPYRGAGSSRQRPECCGARGRRSTSLTAAAQFTASGFIAPAPGGSTSSTRPALSFAAPVSQSRRLQRGGLSTLHPPRPFFTEQEFKT